jgi:hypothetical protein
MARTAGLLTGTGDVRPIDQQVARWAAVDQTAVRAAIDAVYAGDPLVVTVGPRD